MSIAPKPFGVIVTAGVIFGWYLGRRYADRHGLDPASTRRLGAMVLLAGAIGAHLVGVLAYRIGKLPDDPWLLLKLWKGMSSLGGWLGGGLAFLWLSRRMEIDRLRWADMAVYALVPGFMVGRLGCAVVHDHLGAATSFALAVQTPVGPRHDLGLYELLILLSLWPICLWVAHVKRHQPGFLAGFFLLAYPGPRFMLEFLRLDATDPRHIGLTPAQFLAVSMLAAGVLVMRASLRFRRAERDRTVGLLAT